MTTATAPVQTASVAVDRNIYLDKRGKSWSTYERRGLVVYDKITRLIHVDASLGDIIEVLKTNA